MELLLAMLVLIPLPLALEWVARARRRAVREALWAGHTLRPCDHSFRGYKVAQLVVGGDRAWLTGVMGAHYDVDDHARCLRRDCAPPGLSCFCGFYAFRERDRALELIDWLGSLQPTRSYVLLSADLDGEVLEYEHGFRAQRQRVVRIEVPDRCQPCAAQGQGMGVATALVTHPRFRSEQLFAQQDLVSRLALPMGSAPLRPLCARHTPPSLARLHTLPELRGLIGTEVTILPPQERPRRPAATEEAA